MKFYNVDPNSLSDFLTKKDLNSSQGDSSSYKYNGIAQPDILPQDREVYQQYLQKHIDKGLELSKQIQQNPNNDYRPQLLQLQTELVSDINGGDIGHLVERKKDHDNYLAAAKKAKTPQEYNEALNSIQIEPAIKEDGTKGRVYMNDFYSSTDDKNFDSGLRSFANTIKPDQEVKNWMQRNNMDPSKFDLYTHDQISEVTYKAASDMIDEYTKGTDAYRRWQELNPGIELRNEDGSYNFDNPFALKANSYANAVARRSVEQKQIHVLDPNERRALMYAKEKAKDDSKPEPIWKTITNEFMDNIGEKDKEVDNGVIWEKGKEPKIDKYKIFDPEKVISAVRQKIAPFIGSSANSVGLVTASEAKGLKLPHKDYVKVRYLNKGKNVSVYIDLRSSKEELKKNITNLVLAISDNTQDTRTKDASE